MGRMRRKRLRLPGPTRVVALVVLAVLVGATAARASDRGTATAVVTSQLALIEKQRALNRCLVASPSKNTPCIRKKSLSLAALALRHINLIQTAMDGTEKPCVRTVAQQELAYLRIWRAGALALSRNERKKAKRLFLQSGSIIDAQKRVQPACFSDVFAGP
jgi:hypothetical protein